MSQGIPNRNSLNRKGYEFMRRKVLDNKISIEEWREYCTNLLYKEIENQNEPTTSL